jgi:hypothetical protein
VFVAERSGQIALEQGIELLSEIVVLSGKPTCLKANTLPNDNSLSVHYLRKCVATVHLILYDSVY